MNKRKCLKCGSTLIPLLSTERDKPHQIAVTKRFKCEACGVEFTAAELHGDFWGHVHAFINEGDGECSKMFLAGKLEDFERAWLGDNGRVARLVAEPWFADAKPSAQRIGSKTIRNYLQSQVDYYKDFERVLSEPS